MFLKLFPHGKGPGRGPVNYLLRMDYPGRTEAPPVVLRGDPDVTRDLIDAQERAWKFSAGTLSWGPEDTVTPEQEQRLMDDLERTAFAGLEPDRYDILWVRHSHAGHHELHFVTPRVELATGKALNAFPPGWQKDFDPLRDLHNWREGWTRPDDPERRRAIRPAHADLDYARRLRYGLETKEHSRKVITEYLNAQLEAGLITCREDALKALRDGGLEIPRQGKDYVTVLDNKSGERLRLKGGIFDESWRLDQSLARADRQGPGGDGADRPERVAALAAELERVIQRRAEYNGKRYRRPEPGRTAKRHSEPERDGTEHRALAERPGVDRAAEHAHRPGVDAGHWDRCLGPDDGPVLALGEPSGRGGAVEDPARRAQGTSYGLGAQDLGDRADGGPERALHRPAVRNESATLRDQRQAPSPAPGVNHERTGIASGGRPGQVGEPRGQRTGGAESDHRELDEALARIRAAIAALERCVQRIRELVATLERAGRKVMAHSKQKRNMACLEREL